MWTNKTWQGKLGGIVLGLAGAFQMALPYSGTELDRRLEAIAMIGLGLGMFGLLEAIGSSRKER